MLNIRLSVFVLSFAISFYLIKIIMIWLSVFPEIPPGPRLWPRISAQLVLILDTNVNHNEIQLKFYKNFVE